MKHEFLSLHWRRVVTHSRANTAIWMPAFVFAKRGFWLVLVFACHNLALVHQLLDQFAQGIWTCDMAQAADF